MVQGLRKVIVGLTGTFGAGKSRLGKIFRRLGACVIDSDKLVHEALEPAHPIFEKVVKLFGSGVLASGRQLDRKKIAEIVFRDPAKRKKLEALLHPYVFRRIREETARAKEQVVVAEVPLLFETGFDKHCDYSVVVYANAKTIERRLKIKGFTPGEIKSRSQTQMPQEEKLKRTQLAIDNSKSIRETSRQVKAVWHQINQDFKGE